MIQVLSETLPDVCHAAGGAPPPQKKITGAAIQVLCRPCEASFTKALAPRRQSSSFALQQLAAVDPMQLSTLSPHFDVTQRPVTQVGWFGSGMLSDPRHDGHHRLTHTSAAPTNVLPVFCPPVLQNKFTDINTPLGTLPRHGKKTR